ncbi:site-specific integrase [Brevundimonas sp.]|uniref:tyrosine-type recombinase/integrase n=1 Tax=Brevundimonas sp. TaxID=1871086 RepID=UPI002D6148C6|nr:site-specific integrase [Brevundimonas sp.]HYC66692.1 site-specific integrase [Brevundimonas sp.]
MLYKRGEFWHYDFTVNDRRYRASTKLHRKAAAQIAEDRAREAAILGSSDRPIPTIEQAADAWFAANRAGSRSEVTTAQRLNIMLRLIGTDTPVNRIDAPEIAEAIATRRVETTRQGRAPANATVNRDLIDTTLRPILTYAKEIMKAPVNDIPWKALRLKEPPERDRAFTQAELTSWRAALPEWHRAVFDFAARYGVRLREAFFPPDCYDAATGTVFLRLRKNGKPHAIRLLPDDAADMTARYGRAVAADLDTVWFKETKGGLAPIRWRGFQSASRKALDRAGITGARPAHDLRHHAATTVLRQTGNLAAVKRLLGHEDIASTMRYAHADDDDVHEALRHTYGTKPPEAQKRRKKTKVVTGT